MLNFARTLSFPLLEAFKQCIDTGIKCTQEAVAKISKLSQPYISKIASKFGGFNALKKILLVLIEALNPV